MKSKYAIRFLAASVLVLAGCTDEGDVLNDYGGNHVFGAADEGLVNGAAADARFANPANVEVAPDGNVYVADFDNDVVRVINVDGRVSTLVSQVDFQRPFGLTVAPNGTLFVSTDGNDLGERSPTTGTVWRVDRATGVATVIARNLGRPRGIVALDDDSIAMADLTHSTVSVLDAVSGAVVVLAGTPGVAGFADGTGPAARFNRPYGLDVAADGSLLVADQNNNRIRRVAVGGVVTTFAGDGIAGSDNGAATTASFNGPQDVAVRGDTVYVADTLGHLVRRIAGGSVDTFAGDGTAGFADGTGTGARFFGLEGITVSPDQTKLWIADGNVGTGQPFNRVRFLPLP